MRALFEQNKVDVRATTDGQQGLFSGIHLRHASLERNQRCLLAYIYNRLSTIRDMRWEVGSVLPEEFRLCLCEQETQVVPELQPLTGIIHENHRKGGSGPHPIFIASQDPLYRRALCGRLWGNGARGWDCGAAEERKPTSPASH